MQPHSNDPKTSAPREVFRILKMKRHCPYPRLSWSKAEDECLRQLVTKYGERHWKRVEQEMRAKFPELPINGKKCRERWINSGKRGINRKPLSEREDLLLIVYHQTYSNSWSAIAKKMPTRNSSMLKNNFYSLVKKVVRQVLLFRQGEPIVECSPLQFLSTLYIVMILAGLLETRGPPAESAPEPLGYRAPPHIAQYVLESKLDPRACQDYVLALIKFVQISGRPAKRVLDQLCKLDYVSLTKTCEQVSKMVPEFLDTVGPDEAVCAAMDRVLCGPPPCAEPVISPAVSSGALTGIPGVSSWPRYEMRPQMAPMALPQIQLNVRLPIMQPMTQMFFAAPGLGQPFFTTSLSYTAYPNTFSAYQ